MIRYAIPYPERGCWYWLDQFGELMYCPIQTDGTPDLEASGIVNDFFIDDELIELVSR